MQGEDGENDVDRKYGGGPVEPREEGKYVKVSLAGAWQASGIGLATAMVALGAETGNHLGNGWCLSVLCHEKNQRKLVSSSR